MARPNQSATFAALKIVATGIALPPDQITSQQLGAQLNKPVGHVERRSGTCWHYFARNGASQAESAAEALHNALVAVALNLTDTDLLARASTTAVQALPCGTVHILKAVAMPAGITGSDTNGSCVSSTSTLEVAAGLLNCRAYRRIAIASADIVSQGIDRDHGEPSLVPGDGAAYAIIERGDGCNGIIANLTEMYPEGSELCGICADGTRRNLRSGVSDSDFLSRMQRKPLFRSTSLFIEDYFSRLLQKSSLQLDDIGTVVPYQASHLSLEHMCKWLRVLESAFIDVYRFYGNQVVASIPAALHEAVINGCFTADKPVMLIGTAAGLALAGMVLLP